MSSVTGGVDHDSLKVVFLQPASLVEDPEQPPRVDEEEGVVGDTKNASEGRRKAFRFYPPFYIR